MAGCIRVLPGKTWTAMGEQLVFDLPVETAFGRTDFFSMLAEIPQDIFQGLSEWLDSLDAHPSAIGFTFGVIFFSVVLGSTYFYQQHSNLGMATQPPMQRSSRHSCYADGTCVETLPVENRYLLEQGSS